MSDLEEELKAIEITLATLITHYIRLIVRDEIKALGLDPKKSKLLDDPEKTYEHVLKRVKLKLG
jgi:hypothetical protein